jgi:endonuclease/exonuclease/phosphatase (EEP) superfamily protein YafD
MRKDMPKSPARKKKNALRPHNDTTAKSTGANGLALRALSPCAFVRYDSAPHPLLFLYRARTIPLSDTTVSPPSTAPESWHGGAAAFLTFALFGGWAVAIVCLFARWSWFADILTSFMLAHFVGAVMVLVGLAGLRAWRRCIPAVLLVLWVGSLVAPYAPYATLSAPPDSAGHPLRVMLSNVLTRNTQSARVIDAVRKANPDVLCIQEFDKEWQDAMHDLAAGYPHTHAIPRPDNFGIALWSKHPILSAETLNLGDATVPAIFAKLDVGGTPITVLTVHTLPPLMRDYADTRNQQIAAIPAIAHDAGTPFILIGDLNVTMWSPYFTDMEEASGLVNVRRGRGVFPTWPANVAWAPAPCPIDHVLVSQDIRVVDLVRGSFVGSDHFPVYADLVIPATPAQ